MSAVQPGLMPVSGEDEAGTSVRRPYVRPVSRTWYLRRPEYRAYMLREASSVFVGLFVFNLMVGVVAANRGPAAWASWVDLQKHPLNLALTVVALVMSVIHTGTWFQATPKVLRIQHGQTFVGDRWIVVQHVVFLAIFGTIVGLWLGVGT